MASGVVIDVWSVELGLDSILCTCNIILWVIVVNVYVA